MRVTDFFRKNRAKFMPTKKKAPKIGAFGLCGGDMGIRTPDLLHAKQPLSQLSYTPETLVPETGIEPVRLLTVAGF